MSLTSNEMIFLRATFLQRSELIVTDRVSPWTIEVLKKAARLGVLILEEAPLAFPAYQLTNEGKTYLGLES